MQDLLKKNAVSLLGLMWLSLVTVVMLLEVLGSSGQVSINMENILLITAIGSVLFIVMLVIVRVLVSLLDDNRRFARSSLDSLTIAVDVDRNVYLLPRNSTRALQISQGSINASIQWTDALIPQTMQSFKLVTDDNGNFSITESTASSRRDYDPGHPVHAGLTNIPAVGIKH